jgi:hypothetical protein
MKNSPEGISTGFPFSLAWLIEKGKKRLIPTIKKN